MMYKQQNVSGSPKSKPQKVRMRHTLRGFFNGPVNHGGIIAFQINKPQK